MGIRSPLRILSAIWSHPANRGRRIRVLGRAIAWQGFKRRNPEGYKDVQFPGGPIVRCYADSHAASAHIYFSGMPEYASMQFASRYLRPGDNCLDVGAHIGTYALSMALWIGPGGRVDAFEPDPKLSQRIRENANLNRLSNVHVHPVALLDREGGALLQVIGDGSLSHIRNGPRGGEECLEVTSECLDRYLSARRYALAKLDVEGAEPFVLRGAERGLEDGNPPVVIMEMDGLSLRYGISTDEILTWLRDRDYLVGLYDADKHVFFETARPWERFPDSERNVIAVSRRSLPEVRSRIEGSIGSVRLR